MEVLHTAMDNLKCDDVKLNDTTLYAMVTGSGNWTYSMKHANQQVHLNSSGKH